MRIDVTDPEDPQIEVFQGLRDHVLRQKRELPNGDMAGVFICEGDIVVERALAAGYRLESMLADARRTKPLPVSVPDEVPLFAAGPKVLQRVTGYHQHRGVLACFRRRDVPSVDEVVATLSEAATVLVVEGVNNPTNMGVILRCAAALGVEAFFLDQRCCDPLYRRSARVSMGEAFALSYARFGQWPEGLSGLHSAGFETWALTPDSTAEDIGRLSIDPTARVALLLGAEGPGLSDDALSAVTRKVRIPMSGTVDSINVGSAGAVAFYAVQQARLRT